MVENLNLYFPNIVAALFGAVALALVGAQLASRNEILHAMLVSQASSLGVSLSIGALLLFGKTISQGPAVPALGAVLCALLIYLLAHVASKTWRAKATSVLLSLFVLCLSLNYIVTAAFPALESHFASSFLGDIATTSAASSWYLSVLAFLCVCVLALLHKKLLLQSFWVASGDTVFSKSLELVFYILVAVLVVESTRLLGFLLTVSSLVVLPLCMSIFATNSKQFFFISQELRP
jgi:ABC-type Mn2+/Zn2+ transport system permease subunit